MDRLFVYGSLRPGRENAHLLEQIGGSFEPGSILGKLYHDGWGALIGYPGVDICDPIDQIEGFVFTSKYLDKHWDQLDDFEGEEYIRTEVNVTLASGVQVIAWIYAIRSRWFASFSK